MNEAPPAPMLLMTPGPTRVPDAVLRAGARAMMHHRSPEFRTELAEALELLAPLFGATGAMLPVHTTGRGAMEAAICNLFAPGDELVVCCNGKFGEMWARIAQSYALKVHRICTLWTQAVDVADVEQALARHPAVRAVLVAYADSATGVQNDVPAIARVARARNVLSLVDGISSIGGMPFRFDEWQVDVAITASQKCLMSSPGLAFATLSERAWTATQRSSLPCNYWNFANIREHVSRARPETPGTTPVHLVLQVAAALRLMHSEGLENVYHRHEANAMHTRDGVRALGLSLQCPELGAFASTLTAVAAPSDVSASAIRDALKSRGILTAAGLGAFADTGFRIGHMGDIRHDDIDRTLHALSDVLQGLRTS